MIESAIWNMFIDVSFLDYANCENVDERCSILSNYPRKARCFDSEVSIYISLLDSNTCMMFLAASRVELTSMKNTSVCMLFISSWEARVFIAASSDAVRLSTSSEWSCIIREALFSCAFVKTYDCPHSIYLAVSIRFDYSFSDGWMDGWNTGTRSQLYRSQISR